MPAGRSHYDKYDRLVSTAQDEYLRRTLDLDREGVSSWLKFVPEGNMAERDVRRFLDHKSAISPKHAAILDKAVPGFYRLTRWPWRTLRWNNGSSKLWRMAHAHLGESMKDHRGEEGSPQPKSVDRRFHPIASSEQWFAAEAFFYTLIEVRRTLANEHVEKMVSLFGDQGSYVIKAAQNLVFGLDGALVNPILAELEQALSFCVMMILVTANPQLIGPSNLIRVVVKHPMLIWKML